LVVDRRKNANCISRQALQCLTFQKMFRHRADQLNDNPVQYSRFALPQKRKCLEQRLRTASAIECAQGPKYELARMWHDFLRVKHGVENVRDFYCRTTILCAGFDKNEIDSFAGGQ